MKPLLLMRALLLFLTLHATIIFGADTRPSEETNVLKGSLAEIRDARMKALEFLHGDPKSGAYKDYCRYISGDYIQWIQDRVEEFTDARTPPTSLCVFVLGSLASRQATFFSDLEFGILINTYVAGAVEYCLGLTEYLRDQIAKADAEKTLSFDTDLTPPFYNRETRELLSGSPFLIATPEAMATYPWALTQRFPGHVGDFWHYFYGFLQAGSKTTKGLFKSLQQFYIDPKADRLQNIARAMKSIHGISGDMKLLERFQCVRTQTFAQPFTISYEDTSRPSYTKLIGQEFFDSLNFFYVKFIRNKSFLMTGLTSITTLNIKRDMFRAVEQAIINTGFMFGIASTQLFDILDALREQGVMSAELTESTKTYLDFVYSLRLKEQVIRSGEPKDIRIIDREIIRTQIAAKEASLQVIRLAKQELEISRSETIDPTSPEALTLERNILFHKGSISSQEAEIRRLQESLDTTHEVLSPDDIAEITKMHKILGQFMGWAQGPKAIGTFLPIADRA